MRIEKLKEKRNDKMETLSFFSSGRIILNYRKKREKRKKRKSLILLVLPTLSTS